MAIRSYYDNVYPDYKEERHQQYMDHWGRVLNVKTMKWIKMQLDSHTHVLQNWLERSNQSCPADYTVYSGSTGIILLLFNLCNSSLNYSRVWIQKAITILEEHLKSLSGRNYSFLTGDSGPLAVASVLFMRHGDKQKSIQCMEQLKQYSMLICDITKPEVTDDLATGRAGYLYALLFVYVHIEWQSIITTDLIRKVFEAIVRSGQERASRVATTNPIGMFFSTADSPVDPYVGILYGQSGIIHVLMQTSRICAFEDLDPLIKSFLFSLIQKRQTSRYYPLTMGMSVMPVVVPQAVQQMQQVQQVMAQPVPQVSTATCPIGGVKQTTSQSNSISSTVVSTEDLNQWCHGSAGMCMLFCTASKHFNYERKLSEYFVKEAVHCAELIWEKGLSVKGYGLCHGVAGNAYAMLRIFQITKKPIYIHRAFKFAEHCADYSKHNLKMLDQNSLFEGLPGILYLFSDLLNPQNCAFPGFQLSF